MTKPNGCAIIPFESKEISEVIKLKPTLFIKDKSFYKKVASIALPIALQGLITSGVNAMDTVMVGAVGQTELSAVSLANQFITIFHIFCMGIGMGASVLVARYYGMQDGTSLKKTVAIMIRLCLSMASIFCILTVLFPKEIMYIYTKPEEADIVLFGIEYLWMLSIELLTFINFFLTLIFFSSF